jgi:hypothetical protein
MGAGAGLGEGGEGTTNGQEDNRTSMFRHEQDHDSNRPEWTLPSEDR